MRKTHILVCLAMVVGISVQTKAQIDPGTANLKHKWSFEDGTANDVVGTANGTLNGNATVAGGVLNTTTGGFVNLDPAAVGVHTYSELTVEAWYTSVAGGNGGYHFLYYIGNSNGGGNNFTGYTPARGDDRSRLMFSAGGGEAGVNSTEFDDGRLHHLVCVIDATTLSYYMDGVLFNTVSTGTNLLSKIGTGAGTYFAYFCKGGWPDPDWKGTISEISMYDKALTFDNVKYLYDLHKEVITPTNPGIANLKHQWTFDDGTANDVVGNVHGTLNGAATLSAKALNTTAGGFVNLDAAALAVNTYTELTVESWFTASKGANTGFHFLYYFGNSDGNGNHFTGYTPARGEDVSRAMMDTGSGEKGVRGTEYDDGKMHHAVSVINATTISYYIDGILLGTAPLGTAVLSGVGTQFAYFCKGGWNNDPTWKGMTHKISMYDKALTAGDVKYLYSIGSEQTPSITTSMANFAFDTNYSESAMNVTSLNLSNNIQITAPAGITVTPSTITANTTDVAVTISYDKSSVVDGNIVLTSGTTVLNIPVKSATEVCYSKLYSDRTNIISDYGCNSLLSFPGGWGNKEMHNIVTDPSNVYCGANSIAVGDGTNPGNNGTGSLNYGLTGKIAPNSTYRVKAMIKTEGGAFQIGVAGWQDGQGDKVFPIESIGAWQALEFAFSTGATLSGGPVIFLNNWHTTGLKAYVDNWEMYDVTDLATELTPASKLLQKVYVSNNHIVASFESAKAAAASVEVYNIQGSLLSSEVFTCNVGLNTNTVKAKLSAGIYVVRLVVDGKTSFTKIVK